MAGVAADQQWKDKYRDLVRDYETKEREWSALERALRSAAGKLAFAAMGQNAALDKAVENVLAALRTDFSAVSLDASMSGLVRALQLPKAPAGRAEATTTSAAGKASASAPGASKPAGLAETPVAPDAATAPASPAPDIEALMRRLLDALVRTPALAEAVGKLERKLDAGVAATEWAPYLRSVADSIAAVVADLQRQRHELEEFLEQVTHQLAEFEGWTAWQEGVAQSRRADTLGLESSVSDEMRGLHQEVEDSPDLAALKVKVQSRLDTVAQKLLTFRENESKRLAESERRTAELKREVVKLKGKTNELIKLCADQENRLMLDSLTGVHSRYAYEERLEEEFQRWQRHSQPLTFSIWDVDYFKRINDTRGHDAGDRLLRGVADILGRNKRVEDFLARIGGEEFVLLLPMTPLAAAKNVADKIRTAIERTEFRHHGEQVPVTISCGLTEFRLGDTPTAVYERADRALYDAKQKGRNRCEAA
jgi:diguanylate cyclase